GMDLLPDRSRELGPARDSRVPAVHASVRIVSRVSPCRPRARPTTIQYGYATHRRTLDRGYGPRPPRRRQPLRGRRRAAVRDARTLRAASARGWSNLPASRELPAGQNLG